MILAINGSPRKGSTSHLLTKVMEGCEGELINLKDIKIEPCGGCSKCFYEKTDCHIKDDLVEVFAKIKKAKVIVLATPTYFSNVSWLMKLFMDRTNPLWVKGLLKGKKAALVTVGGHLKSAQDCMHCLENFCRDHKIDIIGRIIGKAERPKDISLVVEEECVKLGEKCQYYNLIK